MENIAFRPDGNTVIAAVNNTSVRVALPASTNQAKQVRVVNPTNGVIHVKMGDVTVAAVGAGAETAIAAGASQILSMVGAETHICAFLTSGATNGNVYISRGDGI